MSVLSSGVLVDIQRNNPSVNPVYIFLESLINISFSQIFILSQRYCAFCWQIKLFFKIKNLENYVSLSDDKALVSGTFSFKLSASFNLIS